MTGGNTGSSSSNGPHRSGPNRPAPSTNSDAIEDQTRAADAVALRRQGRTLSEVCDELGYHDTRTASRAIKRHLAKYKREDAEAWRDLLIDRYEYMWRTLAPAFEYGGKDGGVSTFAADRMIAIAKDLAVLTGADKLPPIPDPEVEAAATADGQRVLGRSLADFVGGDPAKARELAQALGRILPRREEHVVIEQDNGQT